MQNGKIIKFYMIYQILMIMIGMFFFTRSVVLAFQSSHTQLYYSLAALIFSFSALVIIHELLHGAALKLTGAKHVTFGGYLKKFIFYAEISCGKSVFLVSFGHGKTTCRKRNHSKRIQLLNQPSPRWKQKSILRSSWRQRQPLFFLPYLERGQLSSPFAQRKIIEFSSKTNALIFSWVSQVVCVGSAKRFPTSESLNCKFGQNKFLLRKGSEKFKFILNEFQNQTFGSTCYMLFSIKDWLLNLH
jgi:hypothetical protein